MWHLLKYEANLRLTAIPEKSNDNIFAEKKLSKKLFWPFWDHFVHSWAKQNFLEKLGLPILIFFLIIYNHPKNLEKLIHHYYGKVLMAGETVIGNFIGIFIYGGS